MIKKGFFYKKIKYLMDKLPNVGDKHCKFLRAALENWGGNCTKRNVLTKRNFPSRNIGADQEIVQ